MTRIARRMGIATVIAAAVVVSAPYVGVVRSQIRAAFPGQFGSIINGVVAAALVAALAWALTRIRSSRLERYGAIALAFAVAAAYAWATNSPDPAVRAVEHFHFVEYGLVTVFYHHAWREDLVLEKWFQPVLDTPSYVSATGHRWGRDHRADAAARALGTEARAFVSRAYPYALIYWPASRLWLGAIAAAGLLVLAGQADRNHT